MPSERMYFKLLYTIFIIIFFFASAMLTLENQAMIDTIRAEYVLREDPTYTPDPDVDGIQLYYF